MTLGSGLLGTASLTSSLTNPDVTRLSSVPSSTLAAHPPAHCSLLGSCAGEQTAHMPAEQHPLSSLPAELESSEEGLAANSLVSPAAEPVMSSSSREKKT